MPDRRVLHFWDAERFAGAWFAKTITGKPGYMWDAYSKPKLLVDFLGK